MSPVAWFGVETFGGPAFVAPVYQSLTVGLPAGRKSPFSCSHDHDHAGEWCRFTGLTIHLILQTSGQKPDFRTVQDMVLEPAGVSACGNQ